MPAATDPPRRRLPPTERRRLILLAATQVFAEHGYDGASIEQIAQRSGVTRPVVYDHFESKQQLLVALIEQHHRTFMAGLAAGAPDRADALRSERGFRRLLAAFFDQVEADPVGWRVLCWEPSRDPVVATVQRRTAAEVDRAMAALLPAAIPEAQRGLVVCALRGAGNALAAAGREAPRPSRRRLVDAMIALCWRGLERAAS